MLNPELFQCGHEILGTVASLGPEVRDADLSVGERRIVYPWLGCGKCDRCEAEEDNMCSTQRSLGVHQNGGFASHVVVPHPRYLVDPGDVDPALASTFACSGITVLNAIQKVMPLAPEKPIVLIGAGGLGLAAISMLHALGHKNIISVDIAADKREAALKAGANAAVDGAAPDATEEVQAAAGGVPILGVIDFVNNSKTASFGYGLSSSKGAKHVAVGVMGGDLTISLITLIFKAVTILGSNTGTPQHLREVTKLAQSGKLAPIPITEVPWNEANAALQRLKDGQVTGRLVLTV